MEEAKNSLRLAAGPHFLDATVETSLDGAIEQFERDTDRACITQSFDHFVDSFPYENQPITFSVKPVQSVESITYLDENGDEQTLAEDVYGFDEGRRHVYKKSAQAWPTTLGQRNAVKVSIVAGYGDTAGVVPRMVKSTILLLAHYLFYEETAYKEKYEFAVDRLLRSSYP